MTLRLAACRYGLVIFLAFTGRLVTAQNYGGGGYRSSLGSYQQNMIQHQNEMAEMERDLALGQLKYDLEYGSGSARRALDRFENSLDGAALRSYGHRDRMSEMEEDSSLGQLRYDLQYGNVTPRRAVDRYESSTFRHRRMRRR